MLGVSIIIYLLLTLGIGYWASKKVKTSADFTLAGKNLTAIVVGVTIFATWFGPEFILGIPALFARNGIQGIIADQFGVLLCLLLVAGFYARRLYKLNVITVNDFFRIRFNGRFEAVTSFINLFSYFFWIASQQLSLGLIFNSLFELPIILGILLGAVIVVVYTYMGGMWAVSYTDLIQSIVIIVGLLLLLVNILQQSDSLPVIFAAKPEGFLDFFPLPTFHSWVDYLGMWFAFGLGSIPAQEIYQRSFSAKSENASVNGVVLSGIILFTVAFIPIIIGFVGAHMHPDFLTINDGQNLIPELVERYASLPLQMIFFGALISAILSTSSGAMLAPATIIGENIIKPRFKTISDKNLLLTTRFSVVLVAALSCIIAAMSGNIHGLVVISSVVMLVSLFAPFTLGLFWKKTSVFGAWSGLILGAAVYLTCFLMETAIEPFMYALVASIASTVIGSYIIPDDTGAQFFNNQ